MDELRVGDVLAFEPMPKLATALLERKLAIMDRWYRQVREEVPDADVLTLGQVRNSIPRILEQIAAALRSADPDPTMELMRITRSHGAVRFHESYNVKELIFEYRLLRRILVEETDSAMKDRINVREWIALHTAVDIALQQSAISFVEHQQIQLKSATEAEAKFLSFLAHDMRNSLNGIMLTMQWAEDGMRKHAELREEADGLRESRRAAASTIEGMERLLQAERLRKGVRPKREHVNLPQLASAVAGQFRAAADERSLSVGVSVPPSAQLQSDWGLLTLILQNLVGNAVKYSDRGTIVIEATPLKDEGGEAWVLSVKDEGKGIAPEKQTALFEAFTRGETHGQPGVGLGLFIASQAARLLGTKLTVESQVGKGSTFSIIVRDSPRDDVGE